MAEAEEGYCFVDWIGDVDTIADVNATTITIHGDCEITANFEERNECFIATAAYGTPMAAALQALRDLRDEYVLTNLVGQALVGLYYRVSPAIAEFMNNRPSLKPMVRARLLSAVALSTVAVNASPARRWP